MQVISIRGRDKFHKYRTQLIWLSKFYKIFPLKIRKKMLEKHRNTRGILGYALRFALLKAICKECGDNISVSPGVYINNAQNLSLGKNISIHPMCYIECGPFDDSGIIIEDDVSIAHGTTIICTSHTYNHEEIRTIKDMPVKYETVHICKNVWIGAKATILCGVTIESGCVIGANSVLTKSTKADGIYVGSPATRIKDRI